VEYLHFHTEELPELADAGARFVVVAYCGSWRDGEVTNDAAQIPALKRTLRKRFMGRLVAPKRPAKIATAGYYSTDNGGFERI